MIGVSSGVPGCGEKDFGRGRWNENGGGIDGFYGVGRISQSIKKSNHFWGKKRTSGK